jgi:hypothetical protein
MHMRELGISVCASILLGALQLQAAALNVIQAYEGPAQPASAVVRLYLARGAEIHQIDGHLVAANPFVDVVELLPGHHEVRVGYKEGGVSAYGLVLSDKQYSSTEGAQVAFDAAAGSVYQLQTRADLGQMRWNPAVAPYSPPATEASRGERRSIACWRSEVSGAVVEGWTAKGFGGGQFTFLSDGAKEPVRLFTTNETGYNGKSKWGVKTGKALAAGKRAHLSYRECDSKVIVFAEE